MTIEKFNEIVTAQLETCHTLLTSKGKEYALDKDRLLVFKRAASVQGETPAQALCGMMAKHTISVYDMVMSGDHYSVERWNEKITDSINYLLILKTLIMEAEDEQHRS